MRFLLGCGVGLGQWGLLGCCLLFVWCALLCASVFVEGVLGESVCWRVWLFG